MVIYDAFLSYSHAKDKRIATALQSIVQKLGKPWYRIRALRIFRDDTSLSATPHLWPTIEGALDRSRYFILLASPEAAASKWVARELSYWLEHNSLDTLLVGVTDGELNWDDEIGDFRRSETNPLPAILTGRFANEPKWVDLRKYRNADEPRNSKLIELGADFAAAIHGIPKEDLLSQEVREQKLARLLAVAVAAMMLSVAGFAVLQWKEAEKQSAIAKSEATRAERNFGAAKATIEAVIFDLALGLKDEGLPVDALRRILGRAETAINQLISQTQDDHEVRRSQTVMYGLFSDAYLRGGANRLAIEYGRKAVESARQLAASTKNPEALRDLSVNLTKFGDAMRDSDDLAGATDAYSESLEIKKLLAAEFPGDPDMPHDLTVGLTRMGDMSRRRDDLAGALDNYREALALLRGAGEEAPQTARVLDAVSTVLGKIGLTLMLKHDLSGALSAYNESLEIVRDLADREPDSTDYLRHLSYTLQSLGDVQAAQPNLAEAIEHYKKSIDAARRLSATDKANVIWLRDLATVLQRVGDAQRRVGNREAAIEAHRESLLIAREVVAKDSTIAEWNADVALSLAKLAQLGDESQARWIEFVVNFDQAAREKFAHGNAAQMDRRDRS